MRYRVLCAAVVLAAFSIPMFGISAGAGVAPGTKGNGLHVCEEQYLAAYEEVVDKIGQRAPGRNFVDDGIVKDDGAIGPINNDRACAEVEDLKALTAPPPAPATYTETAASPVYSGGVGGSTVQCESGGDYAANTGNGYYGGYQFDSTTWDAYGDSAYGEANEAPPAVQDAAAAAVPYDAWPNC